MFFFSRNRIPSSSLRYLGRGSLRCIFGFIDLILTELSTGERPIPFVILLAQYFEGCFRARDRLASRLVHEAYRLPLQ